MDFLTSQNYEIFLRLILAVLLGSFIGLERQLAKKTAGLRTFALVSLASCLFTTISNLLSQMNFPNFNIALLPMNIIGGIGFIGAGLIIFHGSHPTGITTAAGLLVSAAVGMAVGFGFYSIAVFTALLTITIFTIFWIFEEKFLSKID
ncbi:MgtC/SapB family protein [Candidatus Wolfebacteria bacterium]|nr:MgtC/SapB family protein [Candidatus Wolfebacteria bacterium]